MIGRMKIKNHLIVLQPAKLHFEFESIICVLTICLKTSQNVSIKLAIFRHFWINMFEIPYSHCKVLISQLNCIRMRRTSIVVNSAGNFTNMIKWFLLDFYSTYFILTLLMLETEYSGFGSQYHACWCPGDKSPGHQQEWYWQYRIGNI